MYNTVIEKDFATRYGEVLSGCHEICFFIELIWDSDSLDWKELSAAEITKRVTSKVQPGSIVLFHNAAKHTPEALPAILERLLQNGYTFLPISQIILSGEYTIDHTGRQCPARVGEGT